MTIEYKRPHLTSYQKAIVDSPERFTITEASTKAGKTLSHIVWLFEESLHGKPGYNYWWVAPVYSQAKIAFRRLSRFLRGCDFVKKNEQDLYIGLPNGATIFFKSAEKPDNLYGEDVHAAVLDEFTRMRQDSWHAVRSTITATGGKCKMIGNVKGVGNWSYPLCRDVEAGKMEDWRYFRITADDAVKEGILKQEEIDAAKAVYPQGVFLELYYCIPNENASDKFCYAFSEEKHIGKCYVNKNYPVYLSFDFNVNPICAIVCQNYDDTIFVIDVVKEENSNIYSLCDILKNRYSGMQILVTGDRSGSNRSALVRDNINYYKAIRSQMNLSKSAFKGIMGANPSLSENQVLVNAILEHYKVKMNPDTASKLIFDCKFVRVDLEGKIVKTDRNDPTQQADALDCFRYYLNTFFLWFLKVPK